MGDARSSRALNKENRECTTVKATNRSDQETSDSAQLRTNSIKTKREEQTSYPESEIHCRDQAKTQEAQALRG